MTARRHVLTDYITNILMHADNKMHGSFTLRSLRQVNARAMPQTLAILIIVAEGALTVRNVTVITFACMRGALVDGRFGAF
jgi:hypothetical protein